jgi:crossover junction endodeoxyribonuclease RusA
MTASKIPVPLARVPAASGTGPIPRTWTLTLPAGMQLLNANDRDAHWGRRKKLTESLRQTAAWLARQQRIPRLERAHVLAVYQPPDKRKRDPGNWYPSYKACIDGIVTDAGILPGDDAKYLDGPDPRLGEPYPGGRIVLVITEIAPDGAA